MGFSIKICFSFVILCVVGVYCEKYPECEGVELQSFIADPTDCQGYIYCDGDESIISKCGINERFNAKESFCDAKENVDCTMEPIEKTTVKPKTKPSTVKTSTAARSTTSKSTSSKSPNTTSKYTKQTHRTSTLAPSNATSFKPTTSSNIGGICPANLDPDQILYLPNPKSCTDYYACYRGATVSMKCRESLVFHSKKAACVYSNMGDCKIVASTTSNPKDLCADKTSGYFEYASNCHFYYRCLNGYLTVQECPVGFGWDAERKMCTTTACRRSA